MAKLENLKTFDTELGAAIAGVNTMTHILQVSSKVWTPEQQKQIEHIHNAVAHLASAMSGLVHNNR